LIAAASVIIAPAVWFHAPACPRGNTRGDYSRACVNACPHSVGDVAGAPAIYRPATANAWGAFSGGRSRIAAMLTLRGRRFDDGDLANAVQQALTGLVHQPAA